MKKSGTYPAFPFSGFAGADGIAPQPSNSGMSFRDYIAVEAMKATITNGDICAEDLARYAYECADLMLEIREK
jgi:hypothetical protein